MDAEREFLVLGSFRRAAERVPAYRTLLREAGVRAEDIQNAQDFVRLPVLEKRNTFQRFGIKELCLDGKLGRLGSVLTSSGHSGVFAFGLNDAETVAATAKWIDDSLDYLFAVRSQPTFLINCLPMGVKVATQVCTLAETSVRPDMAVALVKAFGRDYAQIILVGDTAFIKHVLELGQRGGLDWRSHRVHVIVGEEPLAENARTYLASILGHDSQKPQDGIVFSSMGVAELGLNLFSEVPPMAPLVSLRRFLHENQSTRHAVFGPVESVPSLFTYDPSRIFVEFDRDGRLMVTTLDPHLRVPLVRYATGDRGRLFQFPTHLWPTFEGAGIPKQVLESIPIVVIEGRGEHALSGKSPVYPEAVKEGVYHTPGLARLTTANFRIVSGSVSARIRIQLSPGVAPSPQFDHQFRDAIAHYVHAAIEVSCEKYELFGSGMTLDYERKFQYLGA